MKKNKSKLWIMGYLILVITALSIVAKWVIKIDPFFHYHKPDTDGYFYSLDNQRSQNDGISKHFDYDALITGTSMTENFKTTEMDAIFGTHAIKVSYSGAPYKEINDNLKNALSSNPELKTIVRGLDMGFFMEDKDAMRLDLGQYPTYLYDDNLFNDVKYVFNRDVVFRRVYPMTVANDEEGFQPGITTFDAYSYWMPACTFGIHAVCPEGVTVQPAGHAVHLSDDEQEIVLGSVHQNITSLANEYPDVTFYYFLTPYSIVWWQTLVNDGTVYKQLEAERIVIEEILQCENIKLYSFNCLTDIITDINNYKDAPHYGSWVNSLMLRYMKDEKCLLTYDNYSDYLEKELAFYTSYDFSQLNEQEDYENDYYAEALLNQAINGVKPLRFSIKQLQNAKLHKARIVKNQYKGTYGIACKGSLHREAGSQESVADYISANEYVGGKIVIEDISPYKYLTFYGMKNQDHGQPGVFIYGDNHQKLAEYTAAYQNIDNEWHQYMMDVSQLEGRVTVVFNGGYIDNTGSEDSLYTFSNIVLY